jgi:hypothetical protein
MMPKLLMILKVICRTFNYLFGTCMFVTALPPVILGLMSGVFGVLADKLHGYRISKW